MKALSLWQPWATLWLLDLKKNETRSWATRYRGRLAVHAAQNTRGGRMIFQALKYRGLLKEFDRITDMPRGGIIGTVDLKGCVEMTSHNMPLDETELLLGNYEIGRFMWLKENPKSFKKIIPLRGRQGLFNIPDETLRTCRSCGCSESNACVTEGTPCHWIEEDLCSACMGALPISDSGPGYDITKVPFVRCLFCEEPIGNEPYEEIPILSRFGQMLFGHKRCVTSGARSACREPRTRGGLNKNDRG